MDIKQEALKKHKEWGGKIEVISRAPLENSQHLSLAYTPGVAEPCLEIQKDISKSFELTRRHNLVAVITDGSAVLGLGDIGPEAGMPVMEGKCALFKAFADVDAFPLCIKTQDVDEFVRTVYLLSGSFGGINLEDIAAPRCFEIETRLRELCDIPVFHDDQYGTAIVVAAAMLNALKVVKKDISKIKVVINGAGSAGTAIGNHIMKLGVKNLVMVDRFGIICEGMDLSPALARIVANALERPFYTLSAVTSGVKEVRDVIESAKSQKFFSTKTPLLFIDEIHRFNKSQQDSLLGAVEQGIITLIGATTENPSFEVISPLLSRCQVYTLKPMQDEDLQRLLDRALNADEELKRRQIKVEESAALFRFAGGDARKLLNILDIITSSREGDLVITDDLVTEVLQQNIALYDKNGEQHYDVISAFIKSVRGSDPNAAIYYLARMLAGGEEPRFIARRLVILASEDIGLANPNALLLANACFDTVHKIGMPEARITLAETTIYLATSQKSNSAYMAINEALAFVQKDTNLRPVPLHLRNAVTDLMAEQGYGDGYKYAHDYEGNFVEQEFMPESLKGKQFYHPNTGNQTEQRIAERLKMLWNNKYE